MSVRSASAADAIGNALRFQFLSTTDKRHGSIWQYASISFILYCIFSHWQTGFLLAISFLAGATLNIINTHQFSCLDNLCVCTLQILCKPHIVIVYCSSVWQIIWRAAEAFLYWGTPELTSNHRRQWFFVSFRLIMSGLTFWHWRFLFVEVFS